MLSKKNRISRESFQRAVYGPAAHSGSFSLRLGRTQRQEPRFSFVISKKVAPGAVQRNELRRRGYAVLESFLPRMEPGIQGVFVAKKGAEKITFRELEQNLGDLLIKTGAFR